jgi:hypothetical protein
LEIWGVRAVATVRGSGGSHRCDEELDDAIDLEIEKVRHTTCRAFFSEGSLGCWAPRECLWETG